MCAKLNGILRGGEIAKEMIDTKSRSLKSPEKSISIVV